ncbi:MAG TPA: HAMP domain-containing sensor histidine kinase [Gaiellaceae bacterium]|jgi:two-component system sensor histidine kinase MprB|nr:HAMP domain-containing sensor histidine kinase [Gaiellaceae bacterium]
MSLRLRLTLVAASVVAIVVAAASVTTYFVMRHELYSQVDSTISQHAGRIQADPSFALSGFGPFNGDTTTIVSTNGQSAGRLPIDARIRAVAAGSADGFYRDTTIAGYSFREIVAPVPGLGAIVVGRNIDYLHHDLDRLRLILLLVSIGGTAVAAAAGALVSRATLSPVLRLTAAAERITKTGDPSERVPEGGRGELARLGTSFNTMLAALEGAIETQRRFVADASHELRTPLTSMQTNIEVLKQQERLDPGARQRLFDDLQREAHEMRDLIGGLLELARGDDSRLEKTTFRFDELVESVVERARSRFPDLAFEASLEPTTLTGSSDRLERAAWNLLENAGKWSVPGSSVEVRLSGGELRVRDHGPGIAAEDREHVFDRFYRAAAARSLPGSGLGLAIVREVAEAHGGTVVAEEAPGGGAVLTLRLPDS